MSPLRRPAPLAALALASLLAPVGSPRALAAQGAEPELTAHRIAAGSRAAVKLDGLLDDEVWASAAPAGGFRQREPLEGEPASERTEFRVAYDGDALYVAVMAFDSDPDAVVARILQRDKLMTPNFFGGGLAFAGDDGVALLLDPFDDNKSGIVFATNPNGAEFEATLANEGSTINTDWRGVWSVAAARTPEGWSAEFAIPWRTLRYPDAPEQSWGINVFRIIRRKNEEALWASWHREGEGFHRVSRAGRLTGLVDLPRQGLNLEAKPFVLTGSDQELDDAGVMGREGRYEMGLDVKTELRPGLVLDLTYNTDFAQVEVDDEKVNLTRFDLFFPEKRDFFLENSGIFHFGVPNDPFEPPAFQMFFSRKIGIEEDEEGVIPIFGGARLTGRLGGQTVGLLSLFTDDAYGLPEERFSVLRVKRDVGESNYVGAMVTDRRGGGEWNTVGGVDGQWVKGPVVVDAFLARTSTRGPGGDDVAYRVALDYQGDRWGLFANHSGIGPEVEASSGFVAREDYRKSDLFGRRRFRPGVLGLRRVDWWAASSYATTMDGRLQDYAYGSFIQPEWESGETFSLFAMRMESVLDSIFELTDSADIPAGRYRMDQLMLMGNTSQNRMAWLQVNGNLGRFYGGTLLSLGGVFTVAPTPQVSMALGYTRNAVDVPYRNGEFTADISSLRASYSFSTKLTANVLVQYNSFDRELSTNVRFNFIHRPGSDLFLVFTENRGDERRVWNLQDRGIVMKVTYLARL